MSQCRQRGGAPVCLLRELPALEAAVVRFLRSWCESRARRQATREEFELRLGAEAGQRAAASMTAIIDLISRHGRRPLVRQCAGCAHVGGDEAAFAQFIAAAAEGAREDAILLATLLFRADMAFIAAGQAEDLGQLLMRMPPLTHAPAPRNEVNEKILH